MTAIPPDPVREGLEQEKLRLEIDALRHAWRRSLGTALLSTVATILAAGISLLIYFEGVKNQHQADQQTKSTAAQKTLDDKFYAARGNLSATTPSARINAAYDLAKYLHATPAPDQQVNYAQLAVSALAEQLDDETNTNVLRAISSVLGNSGTVALNATVAQNRLAATDLARAYGRYAAFLYGPRYNQATVCSNAPLDDQVSDAVSPLETFEDPYQRLLVGCLATNIALSPGFYEGATEAQSSVHSADRAKLIAAVENAARRLVATSNAIEAILVSASGQLGGANLNNVVLLDAHLSGANLDGLRLFKAYIDGSATGISLQHADLRQATLQNFLLTNARLDYANVDCAFFEWVPSSKTEHYPSISFRGANWWKSIVLVHGVSVQPWWMQDAAAPHDFLKQKCPFTWVKPASYMASLH